MLSLQTPVSRLFAITFPSTKSHWLSITKRLDSRTITIGQQHGYIQLDVTTADIQMSLKPIPTQKRKMCAKTVIVRFSKNVMDVVIRFHHLMIRALIAGGPLLVLNYFRTFI